MLNSLRFWWHFRFFCYQIAGDNVRDRFVATTILALIERRKKIWEERSRIYTQLAAANDLTAAIQLSSQLRQADKAHDEAGNRIHNVCKAAVACGVTGPVRALTDYRHIVQEAEAKADAEADVSLP
jgi:hypothetical protein